MLVEMTANDHELLGQFTAEGSQDAFTALVNRHLNLVYSAALRQVRSPQMAEEVSLSVFTQLARHATTLAPGTILTAWLYQVTRNAAIDVVRSEARRQAREQIALQMNALDENDTNWTQIEPLLDEAMVSLDETDRTAILLRFFENKSLKEVGDAIGASEDAAQKRVSRALDRLRDFFSKNKITVGTAGLAALVSANAVHAAPASLLPVVATGATAATAASVAAVSSTAVAVTKTIAMTTIQKTVVGLLVAGALATVLLQTRQVSKLKDEVQTLKQQQQPQVSANSRVEELQRERDEATNALAVLSAENASLKKHPNDVLKLRGEVGRLQKENAQMGSTSPLSKATANPEARKMLHDQQKMGMSQIYKGFAQQLKLSDDQTEKFNELLADHIMTNVDHVTAILRDKPTPEQMYQIFAAQDAVLQQQLAELIGQDALPKYQEYTKNLLGTVTADQFSGMLSGTADEKKQKTDQLRQLIQEQAQAVLSADGLPADYQTIPMLNFNNIASEQSGDQSLKILEDIYQRVVARAGGILTPAEIKKFQDFEKLALNNNRSALVLNRTFMAPISN